MVSRQSEKPIHTPPHLSAVTRTLLQKWFKCPSEWQWPLHNSSSCKADIIKNSKSSMRVCTYQLGPFPGQSAWQLLSRTAIRNRQPLLLQQWPGVKAETTQTSCDGKVKTTICLHWTSTPAVCERCVCVCVCIHSSVCVCACVREREREGVCVCMCACMHSCVCVWERERERERERESVCMHLHVFVWVSVCVRERDSVYVCVCVTERQTERTHVCMCTRAWTCVFDVSRENIKTAQHAQKKQKKTLFFLFFLKSHEAQQIWSRAENSTKPVSNQ